MRRHETPLAIAYALARHGPRKAGRVLDPAVGTGVLLEPFFRRGTRSGLEAFALDIDSEPLSRLRSKFGAIDGVRLRVIHADFLEWACSYARGGGELFDCVVMNPPFAGRRKMWRSLVEVGELLGLGKLPDAGPVEAGFVLGGIALLKRGGRLLAVLPASVMTSPSARWMRGVMARTGAIRHVHELPRFAFPEIESRIYLVVYEKAGYQREVVLLNHDLQEPERLVVSRNVVADAERLDFGYHRARSVFDVLRKRPGFGWRRLDELATLWRGTEKTPGIPTWVVHTGSYVDGFWRGGLVTSSSTGAADGKRVRAGDILVRRVSRDCARSFGLGVRLDGTLASDCVLVIRPRHGVSSTRLLFAIRCLMALDFGPSLVERGTGAPYLAQYELGTLEIPYDLSLKLGDIFRAYVQAVRGRCFEAMVRLESEVKGRLLSVAVA